MGPHPCDLGTGAPGYVLLAERHELGREKEKAMAASKGAQAADGWMEKGMDGKTVGFVIL